MLKRPLFAALALLATAGPTFAWTDIYVDRAAMADAGHEVCGIDNHRLAERYRDRAVFFGGSSGAGLEAQVERRKQRILDTLVNASAVETFCGRIRAKDF